MDLQSLIECCLCAKMGMFSRRGYWVVVVLLCLIPTTTSALFGEDVRFKPSICRRKIKTECDFGICERDVKIECYHGTCSNETGECGCSPCWTGDSCDALENSHVPVFQQTLLTIDINLKETFRDDVIATVQAKDPDAELCSYEDDCPCSIILYSIEQGNEDSLFRIDPRTGELTISDEKLMAEIEKEEVELQIAAKNPVHRTRGRRRRMEEEDAPNDQTASKMLVRILFSSGMKEEVEEVHSRRRRSTSGAPDSETFTLEKLDPFTDVTDILIGQKANLLLTIWLPVQSTSLRVELLTPYESSAVMVLCNPVFIHVGSNYPDFDRSAVVPEYYASGDDHRYDHIVLDLGAVSNDGSSSSDDQSNKIKLQFTVILQENNATQYGEAYWVSAGVSYGANLAEVWVGQTSFTPVSDIDSWSTNSPDVNISGPETMTIQSAAIFQIDLVVKNYATNFYLDVIANTPSSGDPVMKICELQLAGKGDSFDCMPDELPKYSDVSDNSTGATVKARLDFGNVVNTGFREGDTSDENNTISTEAVVYITNSSDIINGTKYWLGVTVVVDGIQVYSSQRAITTLTTTQPDMTVDPVIEFYAVDGYAVTVGGTVGFVISIDIPENTTSVFIVDVSMPYHSDQAVMSICRAEVVYRGYNIPCAGNLMPEFNQEDGQHADYVQFNFGGITNLGRRHRTDDSKLKILVTAELLKDHPDVSNGTLFDVTAGVRYEMADKDILWVSEAPITAVDEQHHEYSSIDKIPTFSLMNRGKDYFLYNHSAVAFNITVNIPPETTYYPLHLNITSQRGPVNNEPMFSICRVEVVKIGPNFYCHTLDRSAHSNVSTSDEGVAYQYVVDLGVVTNSLEAWMQTERADGEFVVEVSLHWEDHAELVDGENVTVTVQASYGWTGTWLGSMDYIVNFGLPELREDDDTPQFDLSLVPGQSKFLRAGGLAVYYLSVMTPVNSAATYWMDVVTTNTSLSVCRTRLISGGRNLPCFQTDRPVHYLSYEEDGHRDRSVLDIGPVKNTGSKPITEAGDNEIIAQIVVKLEDDAIPPDNLTEPEKQEFEATVKVGDTELFVVPEEIGVDVQPAFTNFTHIPEIAFTKLNAEPLVTIGGAVVYNLDIYVPFGSISDYKVQFFGDRIDPYRTTVCEARLIGSGWNVPCVNGTFLTTIYNSTTEDDHVDKAFIDAGAIANMMPYGPELVSDLNKVRVQLVVRLENNDTVMENDQVWLSGALSLNDHNEYYFRAAFNATQDNLHSETHPQPKFEIIPPSDDVIMTIGSKETYYLKITTTAMSTPMTINVTLPTAADEAFLTVSDMQLIHVGKNYACHQLYEIEPVYNSTYSTSQNDTAFIDLGVITNHGTTYYYQYNPEYALPEEDEILISLEVQLADHFDLFDGSEILFDIYFDYSLGRQTHFEQAIGVSKTGDEYPEVEFNITIPEYDPMITQQGDLLLTELTVYHTNTSSSHAHSVMIYLMLPYYLELDPDVEIKGPPLCLKSTEAGYKLHFAEMYFTDTFTVWFNISMDPNRYMPIDMNFINTTVPLEIVYYKHDGADGDGNIILGDVFKTETLIMDLSFNTERCFEVLGVENDYQIQDCQITASSYLNDSYSPHMARLNSESGWAPAIRDMKPYQGNDYIEIRFGGMHRFSGVNMQTGFNRSECVTSYELSYSEDGLEWFNYDQVFVNDFNYTVNETSSLNIIPVPFNGAFLRIRPQTYLENTSFPLMRFELLGCRRSTTIDLTAACQTTVFPDYPYYDRGFIVEPKSGYVYVCILEYIDGPTRCSYSFDNGTTWEDIDNNVASIIALEPDTVELFGVSQNRKAIMRSGDLGVTWSSMEPERYLDLSSKGYLMETARVPFVEVSDVPEIVMATEGNNAFIEWGAATDGLYRREVSSVDVNTTSGWELIGTWGFP